MKTRGAIVLLFCCLVVGHCRGVAAGLKDPIYGYNDYKELMWQVIGEEPCLRTLVKHRDIERAELIFLMHQHLYQFPLSYFCEDGGAGPVWAKKDIELLFDAHTAYERTGQYLIGEGSIGIDLFEDGDNIVIGDVGRGSAGFAIGLRRYDVIILVDRVPVHDIFIAAKLIRGKPGSVVRLTVRRGDRIFERIAVREKKEYAAVNALFMPSQQIGYLQISEFAHHGETTLKVYRALDGFREAQVRGIILDLRGNAGGSVFAARLILGYFLGTTTAYLETNPSRGEFMLPMNTFDSSSSNDWLLRVPMIVLVDRHSYSAAEIVASCLLYHHRALIIGEQTGGKGTIQYGLTLHSGKVLFMTMGQWDMINGKTVDTAGLVPEIGFDDLRNRAPFPDIGDIPYFYEQDNDLMNTVAFFETKLVNQ